MAPIYIPPQPVPIIRQKIRNISDIQEQLRAYDQQQQGIINANDVRFNANNINREQVLYPEPALVGTRQRKAAEEPDEPQPTIPVEAMPELSPVAESREVFESPARVIGAVGRRSDMKNVTELRKEIRGSGSVPTGFSRMSADEIRAIATERGISLMKGE